MDGPLLRAECFVLALNCYCYMSPFFPLAENWTMDGWINAVPSLRAQTTAAQETLRICSYLLDNLS